METETTMLTGDTSNESIEALNFGKRKQQNKAGKRVPGWPKKKIALIFLAVALTTGIAIGIWQLVENWPWETKEDDPCEYEDQESCENAKCKWGTPDPGNGLGIQLQRCYRP